MLKNKIQKIFESKNFLVFFSAAIFLLSIFIRSSLDIGSDTGIYLDLGKKIANGKKYYYDFFESNFPLSFYLYALEYKISNLLLINPIILSDIFINILALSSILWSGQILKKTTIYDNKSHYNLIIISYFLGFFLRPLALNIGEFGTKTSLLLIALYPYLSYSFERKSQFTKQDLTYRGLLMGLIPCLKPHYLILIIFIESANFFKNKNLKFFYQLDKLIMYLVGSLYLFLMIKFTPEFFEFVVPMWPKIYAAYSDFGVFIDNTIRHFAVRIIIFSFIFISFLRLEFSYNNKILTLLFVASSILMIVESVGTIDQIVIFYAITTISYAKILFDLITSKKFPIQDNKFLVTTFLILPIFDLNNFPAAFFGLGGFINVWWLVVVIYPFILFRKTRKEKSKELIILRKKIFSFHRILIAILTYILLLICNILTIKHYGPWASTAFNLLALLLILFLFEKTIYTKFFPKFSGFFVCLVAISTSCLFYSYVRSIENSVGKNRHIATPSPLSNFIAYYSKIYAPQKEDGFLMFSVWIPHAFPVMNYLEKDNNYITHVIGTKATRGESGNFKMFASKNSDTVFTLSYLFDNMKKQLKNPNTKLIFVNNGADAYDEDNKCIIGSLEYYFLDREFKKLFLKNFRFENQVLLLRKAKPMLKLKKDSDIYDQLKPSSETVLHSFEVYVRK